MDSCDQRQFGNGSIDPECQVKGCPEACGGLHGAIPCGKCCECLGGCRIAYYRQQEEHEVSDDHAYQAGNR